MKHPILTVCASLLAACFLISCDPVAELPNASLGDVRPPNLQSQEITDDGRIRLVFDEPVCLDPGGPRFDAGPDGRGRWPGDSAPPMASVRAAADGREPRSELEFQIEGNLQPGREYAVELAVRDPAGNSLTLVLPFYGSNPHPARVILNEVVTKTSAKNRDAIELRVIQGGNLGGLSVFLGVPADYDACYTFPALEVKAGDFLVLHCKPEGKAEEIDESGNPGTAAGLEAELARSGGLNASPLARDFWWRDAPGLPDDTGLISLAANPLGSIKDALFYTNKVTVAGKEYRSFGSKKLLDRAEHLKKCGAWKSGAANISVEDGARSTGLSATRSLGRDQAGTDTDQAGDWHVVPSGKATLGTANSDGRLP